MHIKGINVKEDFKMQVLLDNGDSLTLNMKPKLLTIRFGMLSNPTFFATATTDGKFIRWDEEAEISVNEVLLLVENN